MPEGFGDSAVTAERLTGAELKAMLYQQLGTALLRELCPGGKLRGGLYSCLAPHRADNHIGSFKIYATPGKFGGFVDYGSNGVHGDLIQLIALVKGTDVPGALAWARQRLGLDQVDPSKLAKIKRQAQVKVKKDGAAAEARERRKVDRAFDIFLKAKPVLAVESDASRAVRAYLESRGIFLERIKNLSSDVRCAMLEHWHSMEFRDGRKVKPGWFGPALICGIRHRDGVVRAIHAIFVTREGKKAPIGEPKLMLGDVAGGVIQLVHGPVDVEGKPLPAPVTMAEGVEDGLSFGMGDVGRIWAVTSLGNLGNAPLDLPSVSAAIVARDNDWDKPQAVEAFDTAIERLEGHGKPVAVITSHIGKDFNDVLEST